MAAWARGHVPESEDWGRGGMSPDGGVSRYGAESNKSRGGPQRGFAMSSLGPALSCFPERGPLDSEAATPEKKHTGEVLLCPS
ncbi:Phospholipid-Transporting Atpase Ia [Manis pentadactyla]|nr:Phospholipid-Transporting Atpase Ia [Manis pentadactyla]